MLLKSRKRDRGDKTDVTNDDLTTERSTQIPSTTQSHDRTQTLSKGRTIKGIAPLTFVTQSARFNVTLGIADIVSK